MALEVGQVVDRDIARWREALRKNPNDADALNSLGLMLYQTDHIRQAHPLWRKALGIGGPKQREFARGMLRAGAMNYDTGN